MAIPFEDILHRIFLVYFFKDGLSTCYIKSEVGWWGKQSRLPRTAAS